MDTAIIIINWNNGIDTVQCIKSVLHYTQAQIWVIDNFSDDDSISYMKREMEAQSIQYLVIKPEVLQSVNSVSEKVIIVENYSNAGFAGANNLVLNYVKHIPKYKYAWLLNNDAVAEQNALPHLITTINQASHIAFAGSVILDYYNRSLIQCCGVAYYKNLGVGKLILKDEIWNDKLLSEIPYNKIAFQHGASLLVKTNLLHQIGVMDERFFLYSEEHDWQLTAMEKGYTHLLSSKSIVYHKGSMSTNNKKHLFFYYYNRSAIYFTKKHYGWFKAILVTMMLAGISLIRTRAYIKSLFWAFKGLWEGLCLH